MNVLPAASSTLASLLADVSAVAQPTITSIWPVVLIAAGVPFAFYLVHKLVGLIPKRTSSK